MYLVDMHYLEVKKVLDLMERIPEADLAIIRDKPATHDRKADSLWRRRCRKHGIDTAAVPDQNSSDHGSAARALDLILRVLKADGVIE